MEEMTRSPYFESEPFPLHQISGSLNSWAGTDSGLSESPHSAIAPRQESPISGRFDRRKVPRFAHHYSFYDDFFYDNPPHSH